MNKVNIIGKTKEELQPIFQEFGLEKFRVKQIWQWVYVFGVHEFSAMTNISKAVQEKLAAHFSIDRPCPTKDLLSVDGTRKWLLKFPDQNEIETVHIPEEERGTLCVSSQVGCTLNCRFCHTGTQALVRNLEPHEILGQFMHARDCLDEWSKPGEKRNEEDRKLTNIVMMGMGEPLYNYENVSKALQIIMDPDGIGFSKRRITLSTAGVVPMMDRCGEELQVNLAVSLHAVNNEIRNEIVPLNKKYPIEELIAACRRYPTASNARRITFEYVMLKGINDSVADAKALVKLIEGIPAKVNLIPFNAWPGAPYECSTPEAIKKFAAIVYNAGYASPVRTPRGEDILAACGQLKSESKKLRRSERDAAALVTSMEL